MWHLAFGAFVNDYILAAMILVLFNLLTIIEILPFKNARFENSPASRAGLKEGDVLVKINDEDILGKATGDVVAIIKKQKDEFNLTYRRDGEEKTVKIKLSDVSSG